ncbi:MAG: hypothetical protein IPO38_14775 [Rhodocyclaceae bacterium]|nr:hypothetical protein [Rhodocyclaceae bacterium]
MRPKAPIATSGSVRFRLSTQAKRKVYSATITAVIVVLTTGQRHAGFLLLLGALPLTLWLTWSAWIIARYAYARAGQLICVGVWIVALALLASIHMTWHNATRRDANEIVAAINTYSTTYGRCPTRIEHIGIKREHIEDMLGANYRYVCDGGKFKLSYVATFTIFDTYAYDFAKDNWAYERWDLKWPEWKTLVKSSS